MCTSIISLSKIAHQVWHNHSFSQKKRLQKEQWGWGMKAEGKGEGWTKFEKEG